MDAKFSTAREKEDNKATSFKNCEGKKYFPLRIPNSEKYQSNVRVEYRHIYTWKISKMYLISTFPQEATEGHVPSNKRVNQDTGDNRKEDRYPV